MQAAAESAPRAEAAPLRGLGSADAAARLLRDGPNALPQAEHRSRWAIVLSVLREPMLLLLLAATAVYLVLGDAGEALLLAVSVLAVIGLTIYQEQKSERALEALRELGSPRARVLRDGSPRVLPAGALVVGDVILLAEGDRVPADARLLEDTDLHVDESLLSGESVPVRRHIGGPAEAALVHASTLVVSGHGIAEVVATGARTEVGRIGVSLRSLHVEPTPMQHEIRRVVVLFATLALATGIAVVALTLLARGDWTQAVLAGLTLAIATIPEEFPMVLAVFLALGAWRMARHQALVRRTPAIEALGAITVLCTDKTGTLTRNRMAVAELVAGDRRAPPRPTMDPALQALLQTAVLASRADSIDPMDRALADAVAALGTHPIAPGPDASDLLRGRLDVDAVDNGVAHGSVLRVVVGFDVTFQVQQHGRDAGSLGVLADPPFVDLLDRDRVEVVELLPALPSRGDDAGVLQDAEVLGDAEPGHLRPGLDEVRQLRERAAVPLEERVHQQPADGICQRLEHEVVVHTATICDR